MNSTLSPCNPADKLAAEPYVFDGPRPDVCINKVPYKKITPKDADITSLPSIALVTMTKDGATKLPKLFESVKGFVDVGVFLDTSDGLETKTFIEKNAPFRSIVYREPFVNFEVSRTRLNEIAVGAADWLLLLDDDMALTFTSSPKEIKRALAQAPSNVNGYSLRHAGSLSYWNTRLVRGDKFWPYKGVTHEYIEVSPTSKLDGATVEHYYNHGPGKFKRDLELLSADIARDPNNARTIFYLANTLRDIGNIDAAIRFYIMRSSMGGWDEEVYVSMYEAARLAKNPEWMKRAYTFRPSRAEAAHWLAEFYGGMESLGQYVEWEAKRAAIPVSNDVLFVNLDCYGPRKN